MSNEEEIRNQVVHMTEIKKGDRNVLNKHF